MFSMVSYSECMKFNYIKEAQGPKQGRYMRKECDCYEEEVQPYRKSDYKPIIYIQYIGITKKITRIASPNN